MANAKFRNVKISGIVTFVADLERSIDDEVHLYGDNKSQIERIKSAIGLNKRRVVDCNTTALDLCLQAANFLINKMKFSAQDLDGLIFVTQTPDHYLPSNSSIIHGRLGLNDNCASLDLNQGCSGYVYGLWMAHMMISSGSCSKVLLLAGDTMSRAVNPMDRSSAPLFGDAGSATLIEKTDTNQESNFSLNTNGTGFDAIIIPAGGFRLPASNKTSLASKDNEGNWRSENNIHMNGVKVFNFALKTVPKAVTDLLGYANISIEDIDFFVFHQANKYVINNICKKLNLSYEKAPSDTVGKYGNQGPSSIPATINDALNLEMGSSQKKIMLSGFGVGLSWANAIVELNNIFCPKIQIFEKDLK